MNKIIKSLLVVIAFCSCEKNSNMEINVFETSRNGNKLSEIKEFQINENISEITLNTNKKFQKHIISIYIEYNKTEVKNVT